LNVSLTPHLENFVAEKVKSGLYHSASEVIRDGLRLLLEKEALQAHRLTSLNEDIGLGLKQLAEGDTITADKVRIKKITHD
jgi:antitoxin ParD1/3/4